MTYSAQIHFLIVLSDPLGPRSTLSEIFELGTPSPVIFCPKLPPPPSLQGCALWALLKPVFHHIRDDRYFSTPAWSWKDIRCSIFEYKICFDIRYSTGLSCIPNMKLLWYSIFEYWTVEHRMFPTSRRFSAHALPVTSHCDETFREYVYLCISSVDGSKVVGRVSKGVGVEGEI